MPILMLAISVILFIAFTVIGMFIGHIIIFESLALSVVAYNVFSQVFSIHGAISLLLAIATFFVFIVLQKTKFGFWIVSILMSLAWGLLPAVIAYSSTDGDMLWTYVVWGIGTVIVMFLHIRSRELL